MIRRASILAPLVGLVLWATAPEVHAQAPSVGPTSIPPCTCGGQGPHYHIGAGGIHSHCGAGACVGGSGAGRGPGGYGAGASGSAGPITGLPRGRRYYGGRFFGSFNNRYYGPQYGYF